MNLRNDELDFSKSAAVFAANPECAEDALKIIEGDYLEWVHSQP
jgi:hypothetical protein